MQIEPKVLASTHVRLEPVTESHRAGLYAACQADPKTWRDLYPYSLMGEHFDANWPRFYGSPDVDRINFAIMVAGRCQGVSSYLTLDPVNSSLEIGGTFLHPEVRGGAVNPSSKRLLLGYAFESGARRVQFKVDAINARSRSAVCKLGAIQEGILRRDRVVWTGRVRDTVVFSILSDEWPAVREGLDARLAAFG